MKINRLELLKLLKTLSPAIAPAKNQLVELSHVWFSGDHVSAFNDILGIQISFPTEFTGGVLGEKLIGVLENSRAKDVDITVNDDDALFKIGAARIKLSRRPIEDWFWKPELPDSVDYVIDTSFRNAIDLVLMSVGSSNVLSPEQRGITVIHNSKTVDLYSTDAVSMSWVQVDIKSKVFEHCSRLILPTLFCERIKSLSVAKLRFEENAVYCTTTIEVGEQKVDALIFSKLVEDENPVSFEKVVAECVNGDAGFEVPSRLKMVTDRAMVLLGDQPAEFEVKDGYLLLYAKTPYGEVDDALKITDYPSVSVKIDVSLLRRALDKRERMSVSDNCVVMTGPGNFTHIIATKG